jgi:hypothetical protein
MANTAESKPVAERKQLERLAIGAVWVMLTGDPYFIACLALNEAVLFYGRRQVSQFQQNSALEDSQAPQQPNAPETSPLDDRALLFALLRGLYVIAVAGIYLLLHTNNLTISLWDYTSEPKGSVFMFRLSGYMLGGIAYISIVFPYLDGLCRRSLRRERWYSVGRFSALTMLGVATGGLVSLYLP